jgi:predicted nicotinamide N-methyase
MPKTVLKTLPAISEHNQWIHPPLVPEIQLHLSDDVLTLWRDTERRAGHEVPPPYWGFAWPGGQALARHVLDNPQSVAGKSVLDFGTGSGLAAIAAALMGASNVLATDIDPLAIAATLRNAEANGVMVQTSSDDVIGSNGNWDVILIGDMCYERALAENMMAWLQSLLADIAPPHILIADPGRTYFPATQTRLTKLSTYTISTSRDLEDRETRETSVYRLSQD